MTKKQMTAIKFEGFNQQIDHRRSKITRENAIMTNTEHTTTKLRFIRDPGHGWLEVPRADLAAMGILGKIRDFRSFR